MLKSLKLLLLCLFVISLPYTAEEKDPISPEDLEIAKKSFETDMLQVAKLFGYGPDDIINRDIVKLLIKKSVTGDGEIPDETKESFGKFLDAVTEDVPKKLLTKEIGNYVTIEKMNSVLNEVISTDDKTDL